MCIAAVFYQRLPSVLAWALALKTDLSAQFHSRDLAHLPGRAPLGIQRKRSLENVSQARTQQQRPLLAGIADVRDDHSKVGKMLLQNGIQRRAWILFPAIKRQTNTHSGAETTDSLLHLMAVICFLPSSSGSSSVLSSRLEGTGPG